MEVADDYHKFTALVFFLAEKQRRLGENTFLGNEALPASGQSNHDNAYPRVLSLNPNTISLFVRRDEFAGGNRSHVGREDTVGGHCEKE